MGNCFGSASAVASPSTPIAVPPAKKQRKEQPYVTEQVEALRKQAGNYHAKVVECAKKSQQAYQKGDKGLAHTLSEEKKSWQKKKDDANKKAAKMILEPQQWKTSGEIDLHGLYLEEAMDATRAFLKHWKKQADRTTVLVITGAGHHSENQKAVIRPKVEELLQDQRLEYVSVHGGGAFEVTVRPRQ